MTRSEVKVNLSVPAGKIRKINGGNLGPSMISDAEDHPYGDHASDFAALNIPITRLHDAPYENPEISIAIRVLNGYTSDYAAQITKDVVMYYYGLADEDEIITGTAEQPLTATTAGD